MAVECPGTEVTEIVEHTKASLGILVSGECKRKMENRTKKWKVEVEGMYRCSVKLSFE